ncbi:MAG: hypothetical protein KDB33_16660, partial [Acidimicrobiales bacterium]|nr:hypothetical protein [Acidimicrobiales bacterium]
MPLAGWVRSTVHRSVGTALGLVSPVIDGVAQAVLDQIDLSAVTDRVIDSLDAEAVAARVAG